MTTTTPAPPATNTTTAPRSALSASNIRPAIAALVVYSSIALIANYPAWPLASTYFRQGDLTGQAWDLAWIPFALLHGMNPFYTTWINAPVGVNLAQNNSVPLLGLLMAPITELLGPIAAVNFLDWATYWISAFAMYLVATRWVTWRPAAFFAGLLYGFSPYMVGQGFNHPALDIVPIPPFVCYLALRLITGDTKHPRALGVSIGICVAAQYYIFPEIALTLVMMLAIGIVVLAGRFPSRIFQTARRVTPALMSGAIITLCLTAYPIWVSARGPYRFTGQPHPTVPGHFNGLTADLLSTIVPTSFTRLAPTSWTHLGDMFSGRDYPEIGSYIGIPTLLLLIVVFVTFRRDRWIAYLGVMTASALLLSLGPVLVVDNHVTGLRLPFYLVMNFPLISQILPVRLSLYEFLFLALLLARAIDQWHRQLTVERHPTIGDRQLRSRHGRRYLLFIAPCLLGVAAIVSLVPTWPMPSAAAGVPSFFTSNVVNRIPLGTVALISPYPSVAEIQPLLWQAEAGMRFQIVGGYGYFRSDAGVASLYPTALHPFSAEEWLWGEVTNSLPYPGVPPMPRPGVELNAAMRSFLIRNHIGAVIWTSVGTFTAAVNNEFRTVLGPPMVHSGGAEAWFGVRRLLKICERTSRHQC